MSFTPDAVDRLAEFLQQEISNGNELVRLCYRNDMLNVNLTETDQVIEIDGHDLYWDPRLYIDKINNTTKTGGFNKEFHDIEYMDATLILIDPFLADYYDTVTFDDKITYTSLAAKRWCREELQMAGSAWALTNGGVMEVDLDALCSRIESIEDRIGTENIQPPDQYQRSF